MSLRVNTNVPALTALRTLRAADANLSRSLERLSTGLRINRAADDPSGLVISEQLRAQIRGISQALENSQNASNLLGTAEAALNEVSSLLLDIRESVVFAMNTGGNDAEQIDAEQDNIDNAIRSIDRIAQTTKFATRNLLDGSSSVRVTSQASGISALNIQNVAFDGQTDQQFTVSVTQIASQATLLSYGGAASTNVNSVLRVTGENGTQDIAVGSAFTTTQFDNAINTFTADTGVFASGGAVFSVDYGSSQTISVEVVSGTFDGLTAASGVQTDDGQDVAGNIGGISFDGDGHNVRVVSDILTGDLTLAEGVATGDQTFTVANSGLVFQLNQSAGVNDREQVGLSSVHSSVLGEAARTINGTGGSSVTIGGFLSSLVSGGVNDLNTNSANALRVVDQAINEITDSRAYVGAFQAQTVDSNITSLSVALENLVASESSIRDLDFAEETAEFTRNQILFQSGVAVLAQSNLVTQSVLTLLG